MAAFNPRQVGVTGTIEWHGDRLTSHMQTASRRALEKAGKQMKEIAQEEVNVQTSALQQSIRYVIPRREANTGIYRLMFGVWENPSDYAYFQETQPDRGHPFIRPAVDAIAPYLTEYVREALPRLDARGVLDLGGASSYFDDLPEMDFGGDE
jgi:HK97 gp10 family phage protein